VSSLQSGITLDAGRALSASQVTLPYLRVANVQSGWLDLEEVTEVTVPSDLAARSTLRRGDVLMTEGGDLDKLGRGALWHGEIANCLHQNHVFAIRPDLRRIDPAYLALLTRTNHARTYFERTGSKVTNLASTNRTKILNLPVPDLPLDLQRQLAVACSTQLADTGRCKEAIRRQLSMLTEKRQALITAAVTGQIDIPCTA
jgi:type I restriction enzyme S subunit